MMILKKNDDIPSNDLMFEEEVNENDLYDKKNETDIIYLDSERKKAKYLVILAIFLIVISLFIAMFGFIFLDKERDNISKNGEVVVNYYNLYVIHSSKTLGDTIKFDKYRSNDKYYSYIVKVSNENNIILKYNVELESLSKSIDISNINYELYNNDVMINSGILENKQTNYLSNITINARSKHNLELRLWSDQINDDAEFSFKLNVLA